MSGRSCANQRDDCRSDTGLADDVQVRIGFEQPSKSVPEDRILVGDDDPDAAPAAFSGCGHDRLGRDDGFERGPQFLQRVRLVDRRDEPVVAKDDDDRGPARSPLTTTALTDGSIPVSWLIVSRAPMSPGTTRSSITTSNGLLGARARA